MAPERCWRRFACAADDRGFLESLSVPYSPEPVEALEAAALTINRPCPQRRSAYSASCPDLGFICWLTDLGGADEEPSPNAAMLIDSTLASGKVEGYTFSIDGCTGNPVDHFKHRCDS